MSRNARSGEMLNLAILAGENVNEITKGILVK